MTFDYTGIGLSTGEMGAEISYFARDVKDLAEVLKFKKIVAGGWSFGGLVAQAAAIEYPELVAHATLIGTNPPGKNQSQSSPNLTREASPLIPSLARGGPG